jgi:hypothetical protein
MAIKKIVTSRKAVAAKKPVAKAGAKTKKPADKKRVVAKVEAIKKPAIKKSIVTKKPSTVAKPTPKKTAVTKKAATNKQPIVKRIPDSTLTQPLTLQVESELVGKEKSHPRIESLPKNGDLWSWWWSQFWDAFQPSRNNG